MTFFALCLLGCQELDQQRIPEGAHTTVLEPGHVLEIEALCHCEYHGRVIDAASKNPVHEALCGIYVDRGSEYEKRIGIARTDKEGAFVIRCMVGCSAVVENTGEVRARIPILYSPCVEDLVIRRDGYHEVVMSTSNEASKPGYLPDRVVHLGEISLDPL